MFMHLKILDMHLATSMRWELPEHELKIWNNKRRTSCIWFDDKLAISKGFDVLHYYTKQN